MVDIKYGDRYPIGEAILLYDAATGAITRLPKSEVPSQLAALPAELRHWSQLLGPGVARDLILWLMPSLAYAYPR